MRVILVFMILLPFALNGIDFDPVGKHVKEGNQRFSRGDFKGSLENFQKAEPYVKEGDPRIQFNKGNSFYKLNDYDEAISHFEKTASESSDPLIRSRSNYNIGNTLFKKGDKQNAIKSYLKAIQDDPNFVEAKKNLELIQNEDENKKNQKNNKDNSRQDNQEESFPQDQELGGEEEKKQNRKTEMTKEEAERILENARKDQIKRRKNQSRRQERYEIFW
jgi:Ca-activated chloride channel homolog